jgi:peptide chain release factor subunit 1
LRATEGFMGEDVRKLKKGSGSSAVGMRGGSGGARHEQEVVQRNLREVATAASQFFANRPIRRLFLGGTAETVAQFRELLPKKLQSSVANTFAIEMNAGEHEVGMVTLALLREANSLREEKLISKMIDAHGQGGQAVLGLDETLQAVSDKRVQTLIISDGYRTHGYFQPESGYVVANLTKSPLSDRELTETEDVIEEAVAQTMAQGGHVEIVTDNPALEQAGRIGAILRY